MRKFYSFEYEPFFCHYQYLLNFDPFHYKQYFSFFDSSFNYFDKKVNLFAINYETNVSFELPVKLNLSM